MFKFPLSVLFITEQNNSGATTPTVTDTSLKLKTRNKRIKERNENTCQSTCSFLSKFTDVFSIL